MTCATPPPPADPPAAWAAAGKAAAARAARAVNGNAVRRVTSLSLHQLVEHESESRAERSVRPHNRDRPAPGAGGRARCAGVSSFGSPRAGSLDSTRPASSPAFLTPGYPGPTALTRAISRRCETAVGSRPGGPPE